MSYFGHGTVNQYLLDIVKDFQSDTDLSNEELISILAQIIQYYTGS